MFTKKTEVVVSHIYGALWVPGRLFLIGAIMYLLFSVGVKLGLSHKRRTQRERERERERVCVCVFEKRMLTDI
jgi:hypothetical protein